MGNVNFQKAQKETKQRTEEIARLEESCTKMELEMASQRTEFTAQLQHRDAEIEKLEEEREAKRRAEEIAQEMSVVSVLVASLMLILTVVTWLSYRIYVSMEDDGESWSS